MYCITFFLLLCLVPFWVHLVTGCDNLQKLHCFNIFTGVFVKIFCIWNIITRLYQVVHQCGHSPALVPKLKRDKCELNHKPTQIAPLIDEYTAGIQTRPTLVLDDISPTTIDQQSNNQLTQGSATPTSKAEEQQIEHITPVPSHHDTDSQEIDWPDAIPVEIPPQRDQQNDQRIDIQPT